jgi:hypothetical protein
VLSHVSRRVPRTDGYLLDVEGMYVEDPSELSVVHSFNNSRCSTDARERCSCKCVPAVVWYGLWLTGIETIIMFQSHIVLLPEAALSSDIRCPLSKSVGSGYGLIKNTSMHM